VSQEGKTTLSALLSLLCALALCLFLLGYGVAREVPVGTLSASIVMKENGKPLPGAFVTLKTRSFIDSDEIPKERHFQTDKKGQFRLSNVMAGLYTITVSAKAHNVKSMVVSVEEGKPTSLLLKAEPKAPYLELYASQRVFTPNETPAVQLKGFSKESKLKVTAFRLDFDKVAAEGGLYNALAPLARRDNGKQVVNPATMGVAVNSFQREIKDKDAENTFVEKLEVPKLAEGLYWIQCDLPNASRGTWVSVTKIALIAKHSTHGVSTFVTSIDTGAPIAGAEISMFLAKNSTRLGATNAEGTFRFDMPKVESDHTGVVVASSGGSKALVDFYISKPEAEGIHIFSYTDRSLYRPGDLVQYKGVIRKLDNSTYTIPAAKDVKVELHDQQDTVVAQQSLSLSDMGTYNGSFTVAKESAPGNFTLVTNYAGKTETKNVGVADYRKPTYSIKVTPEKRHYIRGDKGRFIVQAEYYFGGPVVGAKVTASVMREPTYMGGEGDMSSDESSTESSQYSPGQKTYSGEVTGELNLVTDENGRAFVDFDTLQPNEPKESSTDYSFTTTVAVKDEAGKYYDGQGSVNVYRGEYLVTAELDKYIADPNSPVTVKLRAMDLDKKPLSGLAIKVITGFDHWAKKEYITEQQEQTVVTGPDGSASATVTGAHPGYLTIKAQVTDPKGNLVTEETGVYVAGVGESAEWDTGRPADKFSITLDKKQYKPGDTMKVLVQCAHPGGSALITLEAEHVMQTQVVALTKKTTIFSVPVTESFAPNCFISGAYVREKQFYEDTASIGVDLTKEKLQVQIASDKPVYKPGENAVYTVKTLGPSGAPTSAEVSLGVVDESVYAIYDDQPNILNAFYPKRENLVQTSYSFPVLYLGGGDKAPASVAVRRKFADTAFWNPVVRTNAQGEASVLVKLPDNIGSWRATAIGIDGNTAVGQARQNVIARKDLMIQLSAPGFMVGEDVQTLSAVVTNNTGSDADVKVNLSVQNVSLQDGQQTSTVHVPNGGVQSVLYKIKPGTGTEASMVAKAWIVNGASDGVELKVPLLPRARPAMDVFAGSTSSTQTIALNVKDSALAGQGGIVLTLSPTIATSLLNSLDQLVQFPYGCTEQTTSRFMPAVLVAGAMKDIGLPKPALADKIPQIAADSYARLANLQHADGGWGWWTYDESDPYMTAYVLESIWRAKAAGFAPPASVNLSKALDWAKGYFGKKSTPPAWDRDRIHENEINTLYLAYAATLYGRGADAATVLQPKEVAHLVPTALAYAVLAYHAMGASYAGAQDSTLDVLAKAAQDDGQTAYWPETYWGYESTARCMLAIETVRPDHPLVAKAAKFLMLKRRGDAWESTRDSSVAIMAMTEYLRHTKELVGSPQVTVRLNGTELNRFTFTNDSLRHGGAKVQLDLSKLTRGQNTLEITCSGQGVIYYGCTMTQYLPDVSNPQLANGFSIQRSYYVMQAQKLEDGSMRLLPSKQPVNSAKPGDVIQVQLKLHSDRARQFMIIEDPVPSSCHITERQSMGDEEKWSDWYSDVSIFDDHIAFFARELASGDSLITYTMRVENPGTAHALPARLYNMYEPDQRSSTAEQILEVSSR
jgi:uncharacterized protein YfaS (alpha-2-macroglobulin family)